jgi:hypothetical protein
MLNFQTVATLNRYNNLQQGGVEGPHLGAFAAPGAEKTDTDFAVLVEVWVESVAAVADVVANGRRFRVVGRELKVKEEKPVLVRSFGWPLDHHGEQVLWNFLY